ncbi:MAG TPA: response regulator transcription factor [Chitinophagaceae bacterium]|nr:response regulator transcription factor [Chitinophagaceae bacterium]
MTPVTISIVEDLDEVREALERLINQSENFSLVSGFSNAEQAEKKIPLEPPDIVIMDINLPGMSGIECISRIKEKCDGTQFMMFTIYEDDEKVFEALRAGAHGYLLKKTPKEKLLEALEELHNGGSPMSTNIARKVIEAFEKKKQPPEEINTLTNKEKQILELLAKGFLYKEIADQLHSTRNTIKQHIHHIYEKLHVQNRTEAINKAFPRSQS